MLPIPSPAGIATLAGTPQEVGAQLGASRADRVLAVAFDHIPPDAFQTVAENMTAVAASLVGVLRERQQPGALERLAEILVPPTPPSPHLLRDAAMLVQARRAVLESGDWLTAAEIASLAGFSPRNPSAQPNKWKKQGQIFALHHGGSDYFPAYGLDPATGFRPIKALARILAMLADHKDSWGLAYWFRSDNSALGGRRPQDMLITAPDQVLAAAEDEVQGIVHG